MFFKYIFSSFFNKPLFGFLLLFIFSIACRKDLLNTKSSVKLRFSEDTLTFDTVFAQVGSSTQFLLVYNDENRSVNISKIKLLNQSNSYVINIDGERVNEKSNIVLKGKDSLYLFVQVFVNPNNISNPFLINDGIQFECNGNQQQVQLVSYGRNANYFNCTTSIRGLPKLYIIDQNTMLNNSKPNVVVGGYLAIDSGANLIIDKGSEFYFGPNAGLWLSPFSNLKVNGTKEEPVIFKGLRNETFYKDQAGQWDRIWINETYTNTPHEINYAIIENGFVGLQIEPIQALTNNKIIINNTIVNNHAGWSLFTKASNIDMTNCVFSNSQNNAVACLSGGDYNFNHCTIHNEFKTSKARTEAAVFLNNSQFALNTYFVNCIISGTIENEIALDKENNSIAFNNQFDHCLLKTTVDLSNSPNYINCFKGNPKYISSSAENINFQLSKESDAKAKGTTSPAKAGITLPSSDLINTPRPSPPSAGAYEEKI